MRSGYYRENGNQDPRGNGTNSSGGHHGKEPDVRCPICGEQCGNSLYQHLPCDGGDQDDG